MTIRLGTRGSRLALAQSNWVAARLREHGHEVEMVTIRTEGDRVQDRAFAQIGQPGVFVREIERALSDGRIDLAVHSYKDLPSQGPEGLEIAAVPERLDPADRLLIRPGAAADPGNGGLSALMPGAVVGTASARRSALLAQLRPDLEPRLLRGNLPTRVGKLLDGEYDAILLAAAGLERLDRDGQLPRRGLLEHRLDPHSFVPAPSQGALALQTRVGDPTARAVDALDDPGAHRAVDAERAILARVEGGCHVAFGAYAHVAPGGDGNGESRGLHLVAILGGERGVARAEGSLGGDGSGLDLVADRLVRELREQLAGRVPSSRHGGSSP
ncbi:MAG: hydroxymethylbilane synthase [Holophagales bacterium]|nr:hydroxymethylbilane synthase [Holophagales bacterium]